MTRIDEIRDTMFTSMRVHNVPPTTENQIAGLQNLQKQLEKRKYRKDSNSTLNKVAVIAEISRLKLLLNN